MPELTPQERLQPALLDRLTDNKPLEKVERRDQRIMSMRALRQSVLRDLEWLLNATALSVVTDLSKYSRSASSTLNFGLVELAGKTFSSEQSAAIQRSIVEAIRRFEPRIQSETLVVEPDPSEHRNTVAFRIEGHLWAQPAPEHLLVHTEIDLELGKATLIETRQ